MASGLFKNVLMGTVYALTLMVANAEEVRTELTPSETMPGSQSQRDAVNAYLQKQDYSPAQVKAAQQLANALEGGYARRGGVEVLGCGVANSHSLFVFKV